MALRNYMCIASEPSHTETFKVIHDNYDPTIHVLEQANTIAGLFALLVFVNYIPSVATYMFTCIHNSGTCIVAYSVTVSHSMDSCDVPCLCAC